MLLLYYRYMYRTVPEVQELVLPDGALLLQAGGEQRAPLRLWQGAFGALGALSAAGAVGAGGAPGAVAVEDVVDAPEDGLHPLGRLPLQLLRGGGSRV